MIRSFNKCDSALLIRYQRQTKSKIGSNRAQNTVVEPLPIFDIFPKLPPTHLCEPIRNRLNSRADA